MRGKSLAFAWLGHPVTVGAVAVLLVNDHALKRAYPGWLTGKLSDVAGLVVLPPVLAATASLVVRRVRPEIPVAVTGLGFVLVKVSAWGALLASYGWGLISGSSVVRADPTDLVALPALGLALWTASAVETTRRRWERFGVYVALPAAVFAIAATTAGTTPPDTTYVMSWHDLVVAGRVPHVAVDQLARLDLRDWARVSSDGTNWRPLTPQEAADFVADYRHLNLGPSQDCVASDPSHCFRVVPGRLKVEETTDSGTTWFTAWEVPEWQRLLLAKDLDAELDLVSAVEVVVRPVATGRYAVVVATGRDGFARRDVAGHWERIDVGLAGNLGGGRVPLRKFPYGGDSTYPAIGLFLAAAAMVIAAFPFLRAALAKTLVPWLVLPPAAGGIFLLKGGFPFGNEPWVAGIWALTAVSLVFGLIALSAMPRRTWPWVLSVGAAEFVAWPVGQTFADLGKAGYVGFWLVMGGFAVTAVIGFRSAQRTLPPLPEYMSPRERLRS